MSGKRTREEVVEEVVHSSPRSGRMRAVVYEDGAMYEHHIVDAVHGFDGSHESDGGVGWGGEGDDRCARCTL